MPFSNISNKQFKMFMSGKTNVSPNLVEENQNDQLIAQEFGAAIRSNLYSPPRN